MKKCNRCGAENKDESNFCHSCGAVLNCSKPTHNSKKSFTERFKDSNVVIKIIIVLFIFTIIMVVIGCANYMIFGDPAIPTEEDTTSHLSEFNSLDVDGDGALSFYEVEGLAPGISHDDLSFIFDDVDNNHNGLLRGGEFDGFLSSIDWHYKLLEKHQKTENEKTTSSSSTNSIPTVESGRCPECGSDDGNMYEYYDEFGRPYYECTVCGYWTYDESDFYE